MITLEDKPQYVMVTYLQDALAGAFAGKVPLANFRAIGSTLAHELRTGQTLPRNLTLDFSPLLDLLHLARLGAAKPETILQVMSDPFDELRRVFAGEDAPAILARVVDFFNRTPELAAVSSTLGSFFEGQFGIALSLMTTFKNLAGSQFPRAVADAALQYFFAKDGFVTVDELQIVPPAHLPLMLQAGRQGGVGPLHGEVYLRDLIRVAVEAVGDSQFSLRQRYSRALSQLNTAQQETARRWFTGFASMAEAGVASAVEETLAGIVAFQGNRLAVASATTYAGTAARKATQHVFLSEMEI